MGKDFYEVLAREDLVKARDLLTEWAKNANVILFYGDDGIYGLPRWKSELGKKSNKLKKLIDASVWMGQTE